MGWFVVLNSLDYFHSIYKYDVYTFFLLSLLIGNLVTASMFRMLVKRMAISRLISIGLICLSISLLVLLLASFLFQSHPKLGFSISLLICLIIGISGNTVQLCYFAMINFVSEAAISKFTIGTAINGLGLIILRMIMLAIAGVHSRSVASILLYFAIAIVALSLDFVLNVKFNKS